MHRTVLRKVGGSVMLAAPPALLDLLGLSPGAQVDVGVEKGRLVVDPRPGPRYTLGQLLAQCNPKAARFSWSSLTRRTDTCGRDRADS